MLPIARILPTARIGLGLALLALLSALEGPQSVWSAGTMASAFAVAFALALALALGLAFAAYIC